MKLIPLLDPKTQEIILFDIYINDVWYGSRRTETQSLIEVENIKKRK